MLNLVPIVVDGIIFFLLGLLSGFIILIILNYLILTSFKLNTEFSSQYLKVLVQSVIFGIFVTILQLSSRYMILSYIDIVNILVTLVAIISGIFLIAIIATLIGRSYFNSRQLIKRKNAGTIPGIIFASIFFFILAMIFFDTLLSLVLIVAFIILFSATGIVLIRLLLDIVNNQKTISKGFTNIRAGIVLLIVVLMIFSSTSYLVLIQQNFNAPIQQAHYFNGLITTNTSDLFHDEIPDNQIRLINPDLANALIRKHASVFGSNVVPLSIHITTRNGHLVWVGAMAPDNFFNQKIIGLLVLDASDPNAIPEKINITNGYASEGLFFDAQTAMKAWSSDPFQSYGRAYITWVPNDFNDGKLQAGDLVQVQTFYTPQPFAYQTRFGGVKIFDMKGDLLKTYSDRLSIPSWVSQSIDENWLEENIANWGHLKSGSGFDIFAGGFLGLTTPSQDRLEISQDTRYIISPDTNETVAVTPVHPATKHLTNAGMFVSTANSITYYDYHQRSYISTDAVEQLVESNEPQVAQGQYYATLPMMYPIKVSNQTRLAWFVPVYHKTTSTNSNGDSVVTNVQFRGLYIYDAVKQNVYGRAYLSDFSSASAMVKQAKENYRASYLGVTPTNTTQESYINASVLKKSSFVQDGTTYIVLETDNTNYKYLYASPKILTSKDWLTALFDVTVGSNIKFQAYESNGAYYLSSIEII